jgi:hypothetical protein
MSTDKNFSCLSINAEQLASGSQVEMIAGAHDGSASLFRFSEKSASLSCVSATKASVADSEEIKGYKAADEDTR